MSKVYSEVLKFMRGKASAYDVMGQLNCLDMVIIRLNVNDFGYGANGGPYILIWRTECDHAMIWGSRDDFFTDCAYRMACDEDDNIKLRQNLVNTCEGTFTAVCVTLDDHEGLVGRMRQTLDLDGDLYRDNRSDREICHSYIQRVFDSVAILAPTATTQQVSQPSQTGVSEMTQAQTKVTAIVARAKNATMTAASLQAGKALNAAALKAAKAKAPLMLRGYLDHPVAPAVIAIGLVSATEFIPAGPSRDKIAKAADLMLTAAIAEGADKYLNVEKMIDQVFSGLPEEAKDLIGQGV